jgi:translation initiation factor IF-3
MLAAQLDQRRKQKPTASHPAASPAGSMFRPWTGGGLLPAVLHLRGGKAISKDLRVNQEIRAREVRLIDEEGRQLGVVAFREALRIAADKGLDLVEVAPTAQPVVCRIMDYGRYKYEQAKRDREARKKQLVVDIKELKMGPNIDDHDFEVRVRNAERFLREGHKLKCTIQFRGRQIVHSNLGREVLMRLTERLRHLAVVEQDARVEGRNMHMVLAPRPEVLAQARAERGDGTAPAPARAPEATETAPQPALPAGTGAPVRVAASQPPARPAPAPVPRGPVQPRPRTPGR